MSLLLLPLGLEYLQQCQEFRGKAASPLKAVPPLKAVCPLKAVYPLKAVSR